MTYLIKLESKNEICFGYRNSKRQWSAVPTISDATTFKTENGIWKALQNGDKFIAAGNEDTCWLDMFQKRGYEVDVITKDRAEEIMQSKAQSMDLKLIPRNARNKLVRAFSNITAATVRNPATNFKAQPFTELAELEKMYDQYPNSRLYQAADWHYVLMVTPGDATYRFVTNYQPLSPAKPQPALATPAPEAAPVTDVIPASVEQEALKSTAASVAETAAEQQPEADEVTVLEAQYRQAYDQYVATWREANVLEVAAAIKRKEAHAFHAKMKELDEQIEVKKCETVVAKQWPAEKLKQAPPIKKIEVVEDDKCSTIISQHGLIKMVDNGPTVDYQIGKFSYLCDGNAVIVTKKSGTGIVNIANYTYKSDEIALDSAYQMARKQETVEKDILNKQKTSAKVTEASAKKQRSIKKVGVTAR